VNDLLFVYGTLRRAVGAPAHELFREHASFVDEAIIQGCLYDLGNFPGLVLSDRLTDKVQGEVYRLFTPKPTLDLLDQYEGAHGGTKPWPAQYQRLQHTVAGRQHGRLVAWVYTYALAVKEEQRVVGGDYAVHLRGKPNYRPPSIDRRS